MKKIRISKKTLHLIKKTTVISVCTALIISALTGVSLIAYTLTDRSLSGNIIEKIVIGGLGVSGNMLHASAQTSTPELLPYMYVDLPRDSLPPLALGIYDSNILETGQDIPQTTLPTETLPIIPQPPSPPKDSYPIIKQDLSEDPILGKLTYRNLSNYYPDINILAKNEYPLKFTKSVSADGSFAPVVLIVHSHGTESYTEEGTNFYTDDTPTRSEDPTKNVVAVGKTLCDTLNTSGVPAIHCETMFDKESYSAAYSNSKAAIKEYIKKYPSIQYVFDVHRDSVVRSNKEKIKPVTAVNGIQTAQAMFVVGTDSAGADHPNWIKNLTVASIFQYALVEKYGTFMRPLSLRSSSFNAEFAPGSILLEMGSCGNTLAEAKQAAVILGNTIAEIILSDGTK